jgi:ABC-type sugar transport system ATPase subunit
VIRLENLTVRVATFCLAGIDLEIPSGSYAVLMGRTGSGKTTVLEAICGLKPVAGGVIRLDGREVQHLKPAARGIGYVPQDRALFQTMTVRENLAFALGVRRWNRAAMEQRVQELSQLLGLASLLDRKPCGLSGGESQRVALGRALAARPSILCLDEPLSALDDETREEMYALLESVQQYAGVTTLHVTHHRGEAERLADRVFHLQDGRIREQAGSEPFPASPGR